ncbi:carbohydrate kinase [Rufibacter glacialis]|uniref:Carbohydrate kinase n=1 Tax=Rufibacter glacialis TaxID=1259555 RepID=A0A5M8QST0_9BACT|nr:carbohydrate kinase [Rufibacter glacialis]KAA6437696.1 carbohydrate kinase [Rufibacter glacialis]GGK57130.1 carbohydrate kinase [Rufibacter glacialis]
MKILSFGEILFDLIEGKPYLGGAPLNFAAHAAQCGAETYIFSAVGQDELGTQALEKIEALGVQTTLVQIDHDHPTGTVEVTLQDGQPDYTILQEVAYDYIQPPENPEDVWAVTYDVLYFGTLAQRCPSSRETLHHLVQQQPFKHVFYDVNLRKDSYTEEIIRESLPLCTLLKLNEEEVTVLSTLLYGLEMEPEAFAQKITEQYQTQVVLITAGALGCYLYEQGQFTFSPADPVTAVDAIGAGDAFSAAFVFHYLNGEPATSAAALANKLGGYVASRRGPIPTYSEEIKRELGIMNPS